MRWRHLSSPLPHFFPQLKHPTGLPISYHHADTTLSTIQAPKTLHSLIALTVCWEMVLDVPEDVTQIRWSATREAIVSGDMTSR